MNKIPVFKTLEDSYGFAFRRFFGLLGICWFPMLLIGVALYFGFVQVFAAIPAAVETEDPMAVFAVLPILLLLVPVTFVLISVMWIGITRLALGTMQPTFFYFSLGYPVWRLLIAMICVYLLMFGLVAVTMMIIGGLAAAAGAVAGEVLGVLVAALASMVLAFAVMYVVFRLSFFLVPVTVAEGRRVVSRSWALSKGNFWRILGVVAGIFIPMFILQLIVQMILMVPVMATMSQMPLPTEQLSPEEGMAFAMQMFQSMAWMLIILIPLILAAYVFMYGLISGASAFAYRSLIGTEKTEDIFS